MSTEFTAKNDNHEEGFFSEQRQAALGYMMDAFAEGKLDGVEGDALAHAALFAALKELVDTYGEDPVAAFVERLPDRVRSGEFSVIIHRN